VKVCPKLTSLAYSIVKSPQFYPIIIEIVVAEHDGEGNFRPEAELTHFLGMRTKEIAKT